MSEREQNDDGIDFSRRTFMKASGAAAGAGLLGAGASGTALADEEFGDLLEFTNPRVQEAAQAWERGYRGRADRAVGLTDSGAEGRHPALGPWNGVQFNTVRGGFEYTAVDVDNPQLRDVPDFSDTNEVASVTWSSASAGTGAVGLITTHGQADDPDDPLVFGADDFDRGEDMLRLVATIDWEPGNPTGPEPSEAELRVFKDGTQVASTGGGLEVNDDSVKSVTLTGSDVEAGAEYSAEVVTWRGVATYDVTYEVQEATDTREERRPSKTAIDAAEAKARRPGRDDPPALVGWNVADPSWVDTERPRDENSHGTHVSGIMTDSGRATAIDTDRSAVEEPRTVLLPGETLSYDVEARAETGVFGSVYGQGVELVIEGPDGRQLRRSRGASGTSEERLLNNIAEAPTVHDGGEATYTVYVRATEGEALPARVERVAAGAFKRFDETAGDALTPAQADGTALSSDLSFHSGVAPGSSLVVTVGLGTALAAIAGDSPAPDDRSLAEEYAETFGVRAVNMSWGFRGGAPLGTVAGIGDTGVLDGLRNLANAGVLPVGSAGNDATPASGNAPPNAANETISTVATDEFDGIASYSSGGIGAVDDESSQPYGKPDVTAPGGELTALDQASMPGEVEESGEFGDERTYSGKGGTSMAAPSVTGQVSLVAEAMEENREERGGETPRAVQMPAPGDAGREDALRLKSVILSTASETAFTAAPYHASTAKAPVYTHGDRDPYEGYGRVNVGASIDAVTRNFLEEATPASGDWTGSPEEGGSVTVSEAVGLDVPRDPRAAAGYVTVRGGTLSVDLEFTHYSGGNAGLTKGDPHIDLFVYDLENVDLLAGDPEVVASDVGDDGTASVTVDVDAAENLGQEFNERTFAVVAKMVNVPGVVNGYDVQANFDLTVDYDAAEVEPVPPEQVDLTAQGFRETDSSVYTGGQTKQVVLTLEDFNADAADSVRVFDEIPAEWTVLSFGDDPDVTEADGRKTLDFGVVDAGAVDGDDVEFTYFVEAPEGLAESDEYVFGEGTVKIESPAQLDDDEVLGAEEAEFTGTNSAVLVGQDV